MAEATRKVEARDALLGRVINDRYRISATIARGGMGKVYRAEQLPLGRQVALKVLDPKHTGDKDPEFHKRFFLEASTAAKLSHPNTVTIFDYGHTNDDIYFIAMELVEGRTLSSILKKDGPMDPTRAIHVTMQMCRSLREAHRLGIIHRDLKPANVLLTTHADEEDFVKVLDFGLVKDIDAEEDDLTQAGVFMGSPKYMSPEQISGGDVDGRSDVYSLGIMLYQMLTGDVPFDGSTPVQTLMMHMKEAPARLNGEGRPQVPEMLELVVLKCLEKKQDDRFASMNDLLAALKHSGQQAGMPLPSGSAALSVSGEMGVSGSHPSGDPLNVTPSGVLTPNGGLGIATPSGVRARGNASTPPMPEAFEISFEEPKRVRGPIIALIVVAALAAAAAGYAFLGAPEADPGQAVTTAPAIPEPEPPREPAEPARATEPQQGTEGARAPAAPLRSLLITLRSSPSGATVHVGDHTYGPTPAQVQWVGEEAAVGREATFRFELSGHESAEVTRTLESGHMVVEAELTRERPRWSPRGTSTPMETGMASPMGGEPVRLPGDYLDSPY